ncbi:hypothetical protein DFQ27_004733 [Actinomortierella ambigua]|uniref:Brain protein I3 n=1 Tax=Actinomortierella ambigua TaxID=1343610 RepID=A0A9P6Q3N2_9FUNG|nr:hypothetical protein DFQ27_004733 [Actinomortierella ambigua]
MSQPSKGQFDHNQMQQPFPPQPQPTQPPPPPASTTTSGTTATRFSFHEDQKHLAGGFYDKNNSNNNAYSYPSAVGGSANHPGVMGATPVAFQDPTAPRPNDILPLHPAIIQQRQIAASLPPCPKGGYHELRTHHALGMNLGTVMSVICFPIVCCCVRNETVCIKCHEKFNFVLPPLR